MKYKSQLKLSALIIGAALTFAVLKNHVIDRYFDPNSEHYIHKTEQAYSPKVQKNSVTFEDAKGQLESYLPGFISKYENNSNGDIQISVNHAKEVLDHLKTCEDSSMHYRTIRQLYSDFTSFEKGGNIGELVQSINGNSNFLK